MDTRYLAFDLGASSSRAILGTFDGVSMRMHELHRFNTPLLEEAGGLFWDQEAIWREIQHGLALARGIAPDLRSVSVDSWGVDYVPMGADGKPLRNAHCYRDPRTLDIQAALDQHIPPDALYATTGIHPMEINTLHQVLADQAQTPEVFTGTAQRLMMADYFNYRLSGHAVAEVSMASTTQLMDARTRKWAANMMQKLGIAPGSWPPIVSSGTRLDSAEMAVIAGCSHDTACAVAAVPVAHEETGDWAYLSSGTWSLLGVERADPVLTEAAREAGLTNEAGFGDTIRLLTNLTGLWVLQECAREWKAEGMQFTYADLISEAAAARPMVPIDLNETRFGLRGEMQEKITAYCGEQGLMPPASRGEVVRLILESLADSYRRTIGLIESVTGAEIDTVYIVGGGSRNALLCQLTADRCACRVQAGPAEATALGNLLIQAWAMGDIPQGMAIRDVVRQSTDIQTYTPRTAA